MYKANRRFPKRSMYLAGVGGITALITLVWFGSMQQPINADEAKLSVDKAKSEAVLKRISPDVALFGHAKVADLYNSSLMTELRKALKVETGDVEKQFVENFGFELTNLATVTGWIPEISDGPPDFGVIVTTIKPYDKEALKKKLVDAKLPKDKNDKKATNPDLLPVARGVVLHLTTDTMFAVMSERQAEKYLKPETGKTGLMSEALQAAMEGKQAATGAINFAALPAGALDNAPAEVRPFFPLIKDTHLLVKGNLSNAIDLAATLTCKDKEAALEAERSLKLLMSLATTGIEAVMKDKNFQKEAGELMPLMKEGQAAIKNMKIEAKEKKLDVAFHLKSEQPVVKLVVDAVQKVRGAAGRAQGSNNLKQLALAMHNYSSVHNGFPPAAICDKKGKPLLSWRVAILPFIEQDALYKQFKLDEPWDSEHNIKLSKVLVKVYQIPGTPADGKTHYQLFRGNGAAFDLVQQIGFQNITDGTSNTILIAEAKEPVTWTKPDDLEFDPTKDMKPLLRWAGDDDVKTSLIAFCDGSVRTITNKISEAALKAVITRAGGEVTNLDD